MGINTSRPKIGVGVLVWRNKQLLLGKRISKDQHRCWQFPGGHLENNETVIDCARREVLEETGLKVRALRHLGFTGKLFSMGHSQYITLFISCEYDSGTERVLEPDCCELWQWFDYQQLPEPLFEPISLLLSQGVGTQQAGSTASTRSVNDLFAMHCAASDALDIP
jgi:8-oxo-dGTP diphosphatase